MRNCSLTYSSSEEGCQDECETTMSQLLYRALKGKELSYYVEAARRLRMSLMSAFCFLIRHIHTKLGI